MSAPLAILYQDDHLVAINKPSGLLVHRSPIDRHETENAMATLRDQLGQWVYPLHRLDKSTSGVLLFALNKPTAQTLNRAFAEQQITKSYLAVVRGFTPETEHIDYPLKHRPDKIADRRDASHKPAQSAVTNYCRLHTAELPYAVGRYPTARYSLLRVTPATGRKHQIRLHLKHVFHPILGDSKYGDGKHNVFFREHFDCRRLLLHAEGLRFEHPYSGESIEVIAPLEGKFADILKILHWE